MTTALLVAVAVTGLGAGADAPGPTPPTVAAPPAPVASASPAAKRGYDPNLAFVRGSQDVVVKAARYYDTDDANSNSSGQEILIATISFTNDTGIDVLPRIDHFEFVDASGQISTGIVSGYTPLVGISNADVTVKRGEAHAYTIGFLVPAGDAGQIIYDTSI